MHQLFCTFLGAAIGALVGLPLQAVDIGSVCGALAGAAYGARRSRG